MILRVGQGKAIGQAAKHQKALEKLHKVAFLHGRNPLEAEKAARKLSRVHCSMSEAIRHVELNVLEGNPFDEWL